VFFPKSFAALTGAGVEYGTAIDCAIHYDGRCHTDFDNRRYGPQALGETEVASRVTLDKACISFRNLGLGRNGRPARIFLALFIKP
jgi:hypothetical protein